MKSGFEFLTEMYLETGFRETEIQFPHFIVIRNPDFSKSNPDFPIELTLGI